MIHETKSIRDPLGDDPLGTYHTYYAYRPDDQMKQIVLPNGEALDFDYHNQGVLNGVSSEHWDAGTITEVEYLKETQYDEAGRVVERTMGNDVVQAYDYNLWTTQGGRLDTFSSGASIDPLLSIDYGYDALGNITGLIYNSDNLTESRVYSYDEINRLCTVTIGGTPSESITYNAASGNIQSKDGVIYGYDFKPSPCGERTRQRGEIYLRCQRQHDQPQRGRHHLRDGLRPREPPDLHQRGDTDCPLCF